MKKARTVPPKILCGTIDLRPYRAKDGASVHLDHAGRTVCEDFVLSDDRQRSFKRLHRICLEYLQDRGLESDISTIPGRDLNDIYFEMRTTKRSSITIEELEKIRMKNQIADIRILITDRAEKLITRRLHQQYLSQFVK